MNKLKEALQKIVNQPKEVVENGYYGNFEDIIHIAEEALKEPTERCYSEEEINKISNAKYKTDYKYIGLDSCKVDILETYIQSLSPKKGKEESSKIDIVETRLNQERVGYQNLKKVFYIDYVRQFVNSYLDEEISISRLCEVLNEDAHNAYVQPTKAIEPNQTEAEKEDKFEKYLDDEITLNLSDKKSIERVKWYYQTYFKGKLGHSLARKQVIEEIEEWAKENTESVENQSGDRGGAIWTSELLTYLQTLKP